MKKGSPEIEPMHQNSKKMRKVETNHYTVPDSNTCKKVGDRLKFHTLSF